jgi:hypothetical protein
MSVVIQFKDPDATFGLAKEAVPGDWDGPGVELAREAFLKKYFVDGQPQARLMERTKKGEWK